MQKDDQPRVFISHASASKVLADAIRDMLVVGGVPESMIFYSSSAATGVPDWSEFNSAIFGTLSSSRLVIALIDDAFLTSAPCLMELGGATTTEARVVGLVVPPVTFDVVNRRLGPRQTWSLQDDRVMETLDHVHDAVRATLGLELPSTSWARAKTDFLAARASMSTTGTKDVAVASGDFLLHGAGRSWPTFYDRIYEIFGTEWTYAPGTEPGFWNGSNVARRRVTSLVDGMERMELAYTRGEDSLAFGPDRVPSVTLLRSERAGNREVRILPAHNRSGARFAYNVSFNPPLERGETADVTTRVDIPNYQYAHRQQILRATESLVGRTRDWGDNNFTVTFPTERFIQSVFLPTELGAAPIGIAAKRGTLPFDDEQRTLVENRHFTCEQTVHESSPGWRLRCDRPVPPLRTNYSLKWMPPDTPS